MKNYYKDNKDKIKENWNKWYNDNKEHILNTNKVISGIELNGKQLDISLYTPEAKTQYIVKVHLGDKITWEPKLLQRK